MQRLSGIQTAANVSDATQQLIGQLFIIFELPLVGASIWSNNVLF